MRPDVILSSWMENFKEFRSYLGSKMVPTLKSPVSAAVAMLERYKLTSDDFYLVTEFHLSFYLWMCLMCRIETVMALWKVGWISG